MKKLVLFSVLACSLGFTAFADKIEGEATCTKCAMKESEKCATAIKTDKGTVYCEPNEVAKKFHHEICEASKKVVAEGTITEKDGKKWIALEKIEAAK